MLFTLDTNILVHYARDSEFWKKLSRQYQLDFTNMVVPAVALGELYSHIEQHSWGAKKRKRIGDFARRVTVFWIDDYATLHKFAEIDAFSQGKHPTLKFGFTARNMGKNDLWIATTANLMSAKLITIDKDFLHLDGVFLELILVEQ